MRHPLALVALAAVVVTTSAAPLHAQKNKEPKRPQFPVGVDTNESTTYYQYGLEVFQRDPEKAADAFYWASRLNPMSAEAYYARRCALLLADRYRFTKYMRGDKRTVQSDEVKRIDSLYYYALTINPFISRTLERRLFDAFWQNLAEDISRRENVSATEVRFYLDQYLRDMPPYFLAEQAYGEGRFDDALRYYASAVKDAKYKAGVRASRGRLFFQIGRVDSALAELTLAVDEMRKADKKDVVYFYESKALIEQSIGLAQERLNNATAAKEAFGRALEEDLSYYPAHVQLSYLALDAKDTTTALNEMDLAVQIRGDDAGLRYLYGYALLMSGKAKEAEVQLRKASELDPVFAAPHHGIARALEAQGRSGDAVAEYQRFLAMASRQDLRRAEVEQRVKALAQSGN